MLENLTDFVSANKSYTKYNVPSEEGVDEIVLRVLKQDCPDFLLPISIMEVDGEKEIRYELSEGTRLSYDYDSADNVKDMVRMKMMKKDFIMLLKNMLQPFKTCGDWFLDYHNILLDPAYILIGRKSYSVKYLYLPIAGSVHTEDAIMEFFETLITLTDIKDDSNYVMELLRVLKRSNGNLMTLLEYILKEDMKTAAGESGEKAGYETGLLQEAGNVRITEKPDSGLKIGWIEEKLKKDKEEKKGKEDDGKKKETDAKSAGAGVRPGEEVKEFGKQDLQGQIQDRLFGEEEEQDPVQKKSLKIGNWGKKKEKRVQNTNVIKEKTGLFSYSKKDKEEKAETAADNNQARDEKNVHSRKAAGFGQPQANIETEMSDDKTETEGILRLELVESSGKGSGCPKTVELDLTKRALTVGRLDADGQAQADYCFDSAVTIISRKHFRVEWSDGQYRINDLGSVNGTYVNEQKLGPNVKRCLQTGDCIKISGGGKGKVCYRVC